jgi:hypothetical protein
VPDVTGRFQLSFPEPRRRDGWFRIGNIDVTTTALLCLLSVASMFLWAISSSLVNALVFIPAEVRSGQLWRLVTWPIASAPSIWVLISIVFFWIFGHYTEELVGRSRFAGLVALVVIAPAAIVTLLPGLGSTAGAGGLSLLGTVMLVLFAAERPNAPFFFGIPAWLIAAIFVGLDVLRFLGERWWGTLVQELLMLVFALVMVRQWGHVSDLSFIPTFGKTRPSSSRSRSGGSSKASSRGGRRTQGRDFDRVVTGPWAGPSLSDQAEMDRLLDKMNSVGLTDAERKRLSELGKKLRGG